MRVWEKWMESMLWCRDECVTIQRISEWDFYEKIMRTSWNANDDCEVNHHEIFHEFFMKLSWGFTCKSSGEFHEKLMKKCVGIKKKKKGEFYGNFIFHEKVMTIMKNLMRIYQKILRRFSWLFSWLVHDFYHETIMRLFWGKNHERFIREWWFHTIHSFMTVMNVSWVSLKTPDEITHEKTSWEVHDGVMRRSWVHETFMTINPQSWENSWKTHELIIDCPMNSWNSPDVHDFFMIGVFGKNHQERFMKGSYGKWKSFKKLTYLSWGRCFLWCLPNSS